MGGVHPLILEMQTMAYFLDNFKRNPKKIAEQLKTVGGGEVAAADLKIYIPRRFVERGLAHIGTQITMIQYFIIIDNNGNSAITRNPVMMTTEPSNINEVTYDEIEYYEFIYHKGDKVIVSNVMARNDDYIFPVQDEFISKGRIPRYLNMEDAALTFENCGYFTGVNLGSNPQIIEMMISGICRRKDNLLEYHANHIKSREDFSKNLEYIGFKNISLMATGTATKMVGNYMNSGLDSALVNKSEHLEPIEEILRS